MLKSKLCAATFLALGLGVASGAAHALTVNQVLGLYPEFQFEDDNAETIVNRDDGIATQLDIGDSLRGIISFPQILNTAGAGQQFMLGNNGNTALSALFEIQVTGKVKTFDSTSTVDPDDVDLFTFTFGSNNAFATEVGGYAGAMISFYESNTLLDPSACGATLTDCYNAVKAGTQILVIGLTGDADEGWKSFDTPEGTDLSLASAANEFGTFNYNLGTLFSTIGDFYEDQTAFAAVSQGFEDGKVEWTGSGNVNGGAGYAPFTSSSDAQLQATRVPEPASLALISLGLLGLGGMRRRSIR